jgi:hypothetical protein
MTNTEVTAPSSETVGVAGRDRAGADRQHRGDDPATLVRGFRGRRLRRTGAGRQLVDAAPAGHPEWIDLTTRPSYLRIRGDRSPMSRLRPSLVARRVNARRGR